MINRREGSYDFEECRNLDICARLISGRHQAQSWRTLQLVETALFPRVLRSPLASAQRSGGHPGLSRHSVCVAGEVDLLRALPWSCWRHAPLLLRCWNEPPWNGWDTTSG